MFKHTFYGLAVLALLAGLAGLALATRARADTGLGRWLGSAPAATEIVGPHTLGQGQPDSQAGDPGQAPEVTQTPDPLWVASAGLDDVLDQYPGSAPIGNAATDWHRTGQDQLERQADFQTPDPLAVVQRWYAARLHVAPDSDQFTTGGDGCAFLSAVQPVARAQHTVTVLLCTVPGGTRVAVTERLE